VWEIKREDGAGGAMYLTNHFPDCEGYPNTVYVPALAGVFDPDMAWDVIRLPGNGEERPHTKLVMTKRVTTKDVRLFNAGMWAAGFDTCEAKRFGKSIVIFEDDDDNLKIAQAAEWFANREWKDNV
jgi:hypothetical protein